MSGTRRIHGARRIRRIDGQRQRGHRIGRVRRIIPGLPDTSCSRPACRHPQGSERERGRARVGCVGPRQSKGEPAAQVATTRRDTPGLEWNPSQMNKPHTQSRRTRGGFQRGARGAGGRGSSREVSARAPQACDTRAAALRVSVRSGHCLRRSSRAPHGAARPQIGPTKNKPSPFSTEEQLPTTQHLSYRTEC